VVQQGWERRRHEATKAERLVAAETLNSSTGWKR